MTPSWPRRGPSAVATTSVPSLMAAIDVGVFSDASRAAVLGLPRLVVRGDVPVVVVDNAGYGFPAAAADTAGVTDFPGAGH